MNVNAQLESKGLPFMKNYTKADYDGNPQTWSIIQDDRGLMYFANNTYILEYDGNTWQKIFLPGDPFIYALAKNQEGTIFVGASPNEFGYLKPGEDGTMKYQTLTDKIPEDKKEFARVTQIHNTGKNHMIFVTSLTIYIYENDTIKTIDVSKPENNFTASFKVNDRIFIREKGVGFYEFKDDKLHLLEQTRDVFSKALPMSMFPGPDNSIYITSWQDSVRILTDTELYAVEKDPLLNNLIASANYNDRYFLGGLYGKGVVITDKDLNVIKHFTINNGLMNNIIWSVYADMNNNIWIATNDGISVIHAGLPATDFSVNSNLEEVVYTAIKFNNDLYIGTSAGVFYGNFSGNNSVSGTKFQLINNNSGHGQIWKLKEINNNLIFGGQFGLFKIDNYAAVRIGQNVSIKDFIALDNHPGYLLTIGGPGLSLYTFKNNNWQFLRVIKGFKGNYRHIAEDTRGYIWLSDRSKGVFRIQMNNELDSVIEEKVFTTEDGLPDIYNNYVYKVGDKVLVTSEKGIYIYNYDQNKFVHDADFESILGKEVGLTNLYQSKYGNIWFKEVVNDPKIKNKQTWELGLIKNETGTYEILKSPFYKVKNDIWCINQISEEELVVGSEKGFVLYDLNKITGEKIKYNALIRKVEFVKNDSLLFGGSFFNNGNELSLNQTTSQIPEIPYEFNDLRFNFAALFYEETDKTQYSFKLFGNDDEWSDWKSITSKEYSNLSPGSYTFKVKAKNLYNIESKTAEYTFQILPPWYQTFWAYIGYFIIFILFIYGVIQLSIFRLKKQRENLKRIVDERTKEIQIQKEEIEAKNEILSEQNEEIIQKNNSITASINYAKRIQEAMLPLKEKISAGLPDNFILFKPRDIVSGDFYWYTEKNGKIIYTAVDCTGHGVPGALMSMIGSEILTTIVSNNILKADRILEEMNDYVINALKQQTEGLSQDGMDMALCVIDLKEKTVEYSGAKNPLIYINDGQLYQIRANRNGIGGYQQEKKNFTSHLIKYESPTWFYMFTDGFQDQFGGPRNRKFMIKRMKELILDIHYKPMQKQHDILSETIDEWMLNTAQTDDILLTGFKL